VIWDSPVREEEELVTRDGELEIVIGLEHALSMKF